MDRYQGKGNEEDCRDRKRDEGMQDALENHEFIAKDAIDRHRWTLGTDICHLTI